MKFSYYLNLVRNKKLDYITNYDFIIKYRSINLAAIPTIKQISIFFSITQIIKENISNEEYIQISCYLIFYLYFGNKPKITFVMSPTNEEKNIWLYTQLSNKLDIENFLSRILIDHIRINSNINKFSYIQKEKNAVISSFFFNLNLEDFIFFKNENEDIFLDLLNKKQLFQTNIKLKLKSHLYNKNVNLESLTSAFLSHSFENIREEKKILE